MDTISVQQKFFLEIKNQLPSHLSLVDEIADLLNISPDSAYRRIRGEKPIDFEEIKKLGGAAAVVTSAGAEGASDYANCLTKRGVLLAIGVDANNFKVSPLQVSIHVTVT